MSDKRITPPYLTAIGAWALAFGCSVGWGSFVMPGTTFLPIAGPVGTALGMALGTLAMILLAKNYHYLMNRYPEAGGSYAYAREALGFDQGFLSAWFLIITYVAILWANASALPLIARTLTGSMFQFGFHYEVAGFHVYMGEILLAVASILIGALICLHRKAAERVQVAMAVILFGAVTVCFVAGMNNPALGAAGLAPAFVPDRNPSGDVFTIFALTPWAFVGFESISHSAPEARFPLKRVFAVLVAAIVAAGLAYTFLVLLAATALPEGCTSWVDYVARLGDFDGLASQPTFFAAHAALGSFGTAILGLAALCGIFTGLIGNYVALSRLIYALSLDGMLPEWVGETDESGVPRNAILCIMLVSVTLPFLGRTAISWIVDVTTVGATIAYAFASASTWQTARKDGDRGAVAFGLAGLVVSLLFALEFLVPNLIAVNTLATESYLILAIWGILGFLFFRHALVHDTHHRMGRSIIAWAVLFGLIIFTSSVWMRQTTKRAIDESTQTIMSAQEEYDAVRSDEIDSFAQLLVDQNERMDDTLFTCIVAQVIMTVIALLILFDMYHYVQKRERQTEVERALAEESSRAKTSFLSNMSHEIRTPMNAIIGLDSIALRNPDLPPRTREQLEKIGASANHLLGLINDILDMSRIESGRMTLKNEEFSMRELLNQVNIIIGGQCADKGLHYKCNIVGDVGDYYVGDDMKLKQVLINILGNSVKFTEAPGDVTLMVREASRQDDVCTLRFAMTDTGVGMDAEYIPKIFEAFSQEDETSTNRYGGSGLGMAITKSFVEMMSGDIDVQSQKGVGSTFTVSVTLGASSRRAHEDTGLTIPSGLRCLVIDDDEIACEHAQVVLHSIGIEADTSVDPHEALSLLRRAHDANDPYQLLLTDYKMPQMDGLELIAALRAFDDGKTAIIMLTGYNWESIEDDASAMGVDDIMAKPLFSDSLAKAIHATLPQRVLTEPVTPTEDVKQPMTRVLEGCRILMAEDVDQNAEILSDLLELESIESERAKNGEIAVRMFDESPEGYYTAILMDVRMPVMDGLTATKSIRALDRPDAQTIPIIAMTANVFDEDVQRSLEAGMNAHLSKPVESDRLFETMSELIGNA